MTLRTRVNLALSIIGLIGFTAVLFGFYEDTNIKDNPFVLPIYIAFLFIYVSERASSIMTDFSSDAESKKMMDDSDKIIEKLKLLPNLFSGRHDLITFSNGIEALEYSIAVSSLAIEVKNTVLRYGANTAIGNFPSLYQKWIQQKRAAMTESSACAWTEIVSSHINKENDPQVKFINEAEQANTDRYNVSYLDDKEHPMLQIVLFRFKDNTREVIFGHDFPGMRYGPAFLTRNENLVDYLDKYFMYYLHHKCKPERQPEGQPERQKNQTNHQTSDDL